MPRVIALSEKKGIPIFSYESANHSLETGDALECLEILTDVMTKTKAFLCKKELGSKTCKNAQNRALCIAHLPCL